MDKVESGCLPGVPNHQLCEETSTGEVCASIDVASTPSARQLGAVPVSRKRRSRLHKAHEASYGFHLNERQADTTSSPTCPLPTRAYETVSTSHAVSSRNGMATPPWCICRVQIQSADWDASQRTMPILISARAKVVRNGACKYSIWPNWEPGECNGLDDNIRLRSSSPLS